MPSRKASSTSRGYGQEHRAVRAAIAGRVNAGLECCVRCGLVIEAGTAWDLGHSEDRSRWTGPEHASCNRAAGARKANRRRARAKDPAPPPGW